MQMHPRGRLEVAAADPMQPKHGRFGAICVDHSLLRSIPTVTPFKSTGLCPRNNSGDGSGTRGKPEG